ncbi:hypothetical protein [Methylopila sp. M107]|uniref:hypothetical protein n=1 Tax=Methylopila sp. M107 TaxID=1101190 RepID=UPI0012DEE6BC|nr:hypothetical protein [Methylopila sp. M107]
MLGVTPPRVSQYAKLGLPVEPDGKIDPDVALKWLKSNVKSAASSTKNPADTSGLIEMRIRLIEVQVARGEVALQRERGEVIDKDVIVRFVVDWNTKIKIGLLNFAARRGPGIAAKVGAAEVELIGLLEAAMREHMNEMADEPLPMGIQA